MIRDNLVHLGAVDRAGAGLQFTGDKLFREHAAARGAAGPAIGVREQLFHLVDPGVFIDEQAPVRDHKHRCQCQPQAGHKTDGDKNIQHG